MWKVLEIEADTYKNVRTDDVYIRLVDRSGWDKDPKEAKKGFIINLTRELFDDFMEEVEEGWEFPMVRLTSRSSIEKKRD